MSDADGTSVHFDSNYSSLPPDIVQEVHFTRSIARVESARAPRPVRAAVGQEHVDRAAVICRTPHDLPLAGGFRALPVTSLF